VADAAHELRSPLASLQAQLDVAERLDEELPGAADIRAEVTRMTALVEDLLSLARLDSGGQRVREPENVELQGLLQDVSQRYVHARVPVGVATTELAVLARPEDLDRALANLLDNAVRHAGTRVEVSAYDEGDRVVVAVEDDGAGIPEPDRERVLERFTRLDAGRTRDTGGSGLGLAIVHELVAHGNGSLRLGESSLGGLRAEIVLPAAPVRAPAPPG
jgi:signal transduction histidine kinase